MWKTNTPDAARNRSPVNEGSHANGADCPGEFAESGAAEEAGQAEPSEAADGVARRRFIGGPLPRAAPGGGGMLKALATHPRRRRSSWTSAEIFRGRAELRRWQEGRRRRSAKSSPTYAAEDCGPFSSLVRRYPSRAQYGADALIRVVNRARVR
ncbi:hypothetical protein GCM10009863_63640 [Streptomyces axinellae]|uniref:Uncharacterized protein n=1 Tax=Streptomyces axinellae TaxID=552788 RepID=A0ABN3QYG3_9ACTN